MSVTLDESGGGSIVDTFLVTVAPDGGVATSPTFLEKLFAGDATEQDNFGFAVAFEGDRAVIGAPGDDREKIDMGAVYVFENLGDVWQQVAKLVASDGAEGDGFGSAVAIRGNTIFVGSPGDDLEGDDRGAVYVFDYTGRDWQETVRLTGSQSASGDQFGRSLDASKGDGRAAVLVVGAPFNETDRGDAYVFRQMGSIWTEEARLLADDRSRRDQFGQAVSIDGTQVIVGANIDNSTNGFSSGSAYIFEASGQNWVQQAKLVASDGATFDNFGSSVVIDGPIAAVGAPLHGSRNDEGGAVYIFERDQSVWTEVSKLKSPVVTASPQASVMFGNSLALEGTQLIIGAMNDEGGGAVYTANRQDASWQLDPKTIAPDRNVANRQGFAAFGRAVASADGLILIGSSGDSEVSRNAGSIYVFSADSLQTEVLPGDLGKPDGKVDFADFLILSANFGKGVALAEEGDIDRDGKIGFSDFLIFSANFGRQK